MRLHTGMRGFLRTTTSGNVFDDMDRCRTPREQVNTEVRGTWTMSFLTAAFGFRSCNGELCRAYAR